MATIKLRRGTAAQWAAANPVLAAGEPGFETDTGQQKIGTGETPWSDLPYFLSEKGLTATFVSAVASESKADGFHNDRAAIAAADRTALASGRELMLLPGLHRVSSNLTVTAPMRLLPGAKIKPDNGVVVTLAGGIASSQQQVFDQSAGGLVVPKRVDAWHPAWWGPVGSSNDSATWKAMMSSRAASGERQTIRLPQGTSRIWGINATNVNIEGQGHGTLVRPAMGAVAPGGYMIKLETLGTISGGDWGSDTASGIDVILYTGIRAWVRDAYIRPNGENTNGVRAEGGHGSITPRLYNIFVYGDDARGSVGIRLHSADAELTNVMVAHTDVGIIDGSGATVVGAHVWECKTGVKAADGSRYIGAYLENNLGWGLDGSGCDDLHVSGRLWHNGKGVDGTGGLRFVGSGVYSQDSRLDVFLDDNVGTGALIDDADRITLSATVSSASVKAGGRPLGTYGVRVTASATDADVKVRGSDGSVTTALVVNEAADTRVDLGRRQAVTTTSRTYGRASTANQDLLTLPTRPNQRWLVRGWAVVQGTRTSSVRLRLGAPARSTGWLGVTGAAPGGGPATAAAVGADLVVALSDAPQVVPFQGFVHTGGTVGPIALSVGADITDSSVVTVSFAQLEIERVV